MNKKMKRRTALVMSFLVMICSISLTSCGKDSDSKIVERPVNKIEGPSWAGNTQTDQITGSPVGNTTGNTSEVTTGKCTTDSKTNLSPGAETGKITTESTTGFEAGSTTENKTTEKTTKGTTESATEETTRATTRSTTETTTERTTEPTTEKTTKTTTESTTELTTESTTEKTTRATTESTTESTTEETTEKTTKTTTESTAESTTEAPHKHTWVWKTHTETIHHDAVTHEEPVYGQGWTEYIYETKYHCGECGTFYDTRQLLRNHQNESGHGSWGTQKVLVDTIEHEPEIIDYDTIIDIPAWDETVEVKDYQYCSECGEKK